MSYTALPVNFNNFRFRVIDPNAPKEKYVRDKSQKFKFPKGVKKAAREEYVNDKLSIYKKDQLPSLNPGSIVLLYKDKIKFRDGYVIPYGKHFIYFKQYPSKVRPAPTATQAARMLLSTWVGKEASKIYRQRHPNDKETVTKLIYC